MKSINNVVPVTQSSLALSKSHLRAYLLSLLENLEFVEQSPRYHPEGNALFHSLQVFQLAHQSSQDPCLWAAALLHDIGKAIDYQYHDEVGAEQLEGLLSPRIVWLIRHHLDLLKSPKRTRHRLQAWPQLLQELSWLRRWDLQGRQIHIDVPSHDYAVEQIIQYFAIITEIPKDSIYQKIH